MSWDNDDLVDLEKNEDLHRLLQEITRDNGARDDGMVESTAETTATNW